MYDQAKSWPFQEARSLLAHIERKGKKPGDMVTFETGFGPSGAPHIGTFGEVVRTLWVMRAFRALTNDAYPTRLIMFSDDYDALRKVPDDLPAWMNDYLGKPLSSIPNPHQETAGATQVMIDEISFAEANNLKLIDFVDFILKSYDGSVVGASPDRSRVSFVSATRYYGSGKFNKMLDLVWDNNQAILDILLPTFKDERRATYSPFMPVSATSGNMLQTKISLVHVSERRALRYIDDLGIMCSHDIYNGNAKLQWYVDWAMRWAYFDVDYEMSGKDLMDSVKLSSQICQVLGGTPPLNLTYELFLDEHGAKISKSKGNGFTIEEWLTYGTIGSLQLLMFQDPRKAKKLYRDLVPQIEDQYLKLREKAAGPDDPNWHFTVEPQAPLTSGVSYQLLLNLAIVSQSATENQLLAYLRQNREIPADEQMFIRTLATRVLQYAVDTNKIGLKRRDPTDKERAAFSELADRFAAMLPNMDAELFQFQVYEVGKKHDFQPLRLWFQALYECLLGSSSGPRFGAFTSAYGLANTIALLRQYESVEG